MAIQKGRALKIEIFRGDELHDLPGLQERAWEISADPLDATIGTVVADDLLWSGSLGGTKNVNITGTLRLTNTIGDKLLWDAVRAANPRVKLRVSLPLPEGAAFQIWGQVLEGTFDVITADFTGSLENTLPVELTLRSVSPFLPPDGPAAAPTAQPLVDKRLPTLSDADAIYDAAWVGRYVYVLADVGTGANDILRFTTTTEGTDSSFRGIQFASGNEIDGLSSLPGYPTELALFRINRANPLYLASVDDASWDLQTLVSITFTYLIGNALRVTGERTFKDIWQHTDGSYRFVIPFDNGTGTTVRTVRVDEDLETQTGSSGVADRVIPRRYPLAGDFNFAAARETTWYANPTDTKLTAYTTATGVLNADKDIDVSDLLPENATLLGFTPSPDVSRMAVFVKSGTNYTVHFVSIP